jgi:hypothetical protein
MQEIRKRSSKTELLLPGLDTRFDNDKHNIIQNETGFVTVTLTEN